MQVSNNKGTFLDFKLFDETTIVIILKTFYPKLLNKGCKYLFQISTSCECPATFSKQEVIPQSYQLVKLSKIEVYFII